MFYCRQIRRYSFDLVLMLMLLLVLVSTSVSASSTDKLSGSAALNVLVKDKAAKELHLKHRLDIKHEFDEWRNNYILDVFLKTAQKKQADTDRKKYQTTAQKWYVSAQTNYTFSKKEKRYVFGFGTYTDDRFNGYNFQSSWSIGYGKRWYQKDDNYFDAELGLGYSLDKPRDKMTEKKSIVRVATSFEHKLLNDIVFKQTIGADVAISNNDNTKIKQVASLTTKILKSLGLKFNFIVDYSTKVAQGKQRTNTETSVSLVYSF